MNERSPTIARDMAHAFARGQTNDANRSLEKLMNMQDVESDIQNSRRGNFRQFAEHPHPTDMNMLSFCSPYLGYVALEHIKSIEPSLRDRLRRQTMPECLIGFDGHYRDKSGEQAQGPTPRWWQCNIWSLNIAGRLMIGRAMAEESHIDKACRQLAEYRRLVELYGIGEYNSPSYLRVQLEGLHWAWHYAPDRKSREDAERLLDETYLDLAEHYHAAAGVLAGTWSRHYERDFRDQGGYMSFVESAFNRKTPSLLTGLGLQDYVCPEEIRRIALLHRPYSVWRRSVTDARRMLYQTPEYSLATQSGEYVWKQQDTPVLATYTARHGKRRTALIRTPYWATDRVAAADYAMPFVRWAHQHENRAILSYFHRQIGNDLLFNLATPKEFKPELTDGQGNALTAPVLPIMPAPPGSDLPERQPSNPSHAGRSSDLTCLNPADREPPGEPVNGALLIGFPSCFLALIPAAELKLRVAIMREDLYAVIPVRPAAHLALIMLGRSQCSTINEFAELIKQVTLEKTALPNLPQAIRLSGCGPALTAGTGAEGRLFDRRVEERSLPECSYLCHSPFYRRRTGEPITKEQPAVRQS